MSKEYIKYLNKLKINKIIILTIKLLIIILFTILWEYTSKKGIINSFIFSSPSLIINTFIKLLNNNLFFHIYITLKEILIAFLITNILSFLIAIIMYKNELLAKILDPYLVMLNSLPKVSLGPILIIWMGANNKSIISMGIFISIIISIESLYNSFINTDKIKIKLLKSFNASKKDIIFKLIIPSNKSNIINILKINMSMCIIGLMV
jgi:NitT/TauT family transport system permease protein